MAANISFYPLGDSAITIEFGQEIQEETHKAIYAFAQTLEKRSFRGMVEIVPAYTTVTVYYDLFEIIRSGAVKGFSVYDHVKSFLQETADTLTIVSRAAPVTVSVPVCYGRELGPDLADVAAANKLSIADVIKRHSSRSYLVYMIGFAPGFPYLGGMDPAIAMPRKSSPRFSVPAGSVGIAGPQTGVYPIETPGGWQIIGRTPLRLFRPENEQQPSLLQAGNRLQFIPVSEEEYEQLKKKNTE